MKTFALIFFGMLLSLQAIASECVGLAQDGYFKMPSLLADALDESMMQDPSGKGPIRGANTNPIGYLQGVQKIAPEVTLETLSSYLRSLKVKEMPAGHIRLSRVCKGVLDTDLGNTRQAKSGENGWYDPNNNKFVMAGDCTNTFISVLTVRIDRGSLGKTRNFTDPYAGMQGCALGSTEFKYLGIRMLAENAAKDTCAQEHMLPEDARVKGDPGDWLSPDRFSRTCGQRLSEHQLGAKAHPLEVLLVTGQKETVLFEGTLTGDTFSGDDSANLAILSKDSKAIGIGPEFDGIVVARFKDMSRVRSPAPSGIGEDLQNLQAGCHVNLFTGIEK